jgi:hypothetical protein
MPTVPHKDRDSAIDERLGERRQRSATKSERDLNRPHKPRSSRTKVIDPETGEVVRSPHKRRKEKETGSESSRLMAEAVPELARTASAPGSVSRSNLPYPTFSKAHSREAINSKEDVRSQKPSVYTPDPTDLGPADKPRAKSTDGLEKGRAGRSDKSGRPPSPPETEFSQEMKATVNLESQQGPSSRASHRSWLERTPSKEKDVTSKLSLKSKSSKTSKASTAVRMPKTKPSNAAVVEVVDEDQGSDLSGEVESASGFDSNATSVAPKRGQNSPAGRKPSTLDTYSSPESAQDSSPKTPIATPNLPQAEFKPTPSQFVSFDLPGEQNEPYDSPQPPPPPPPPIVPINIPRVDYLMQNGGLLRTIPRALLAVTPNISQLDLATKSSAPTRADVEKVFGPFYILLNQYEAVLEKNGSIAVATGYRSVARRLLDRLEAIFARDLSSEACYCIMCRGMDGSDRGGNKGLGWGEVLEWVGGRRDLPEWPAVDFATMGVKEEDLQGLGISGQPGVENGSSRPRSPVKIDPDIAEEFREHYLRQSQKTKAAVSKWLSSTPAAAAAPPQDVDDETLTFTILTHLDPEERPIFNALLSGSMKLIQSTSRAPTPISKPRSDFLIRTGQALQRLYRLPELPRDPESCVYLLKNPHAHNLLATLSGINPSEWEILTSGRFDGFLWSGAESDFPSSMFNSPAVSRNPTPAPNGLTSRGPTPAQRHPSISRTTTPFSIRNQTFSPSITGYPSRGPTPASMVAPMSVPGTPFHSQNRNPVSNDEEAEIAALAEVEREIYAGMEALEDAFETLHRKAEIVRRALRERGAGLSMMAQRRRVSTGLDGGVEFARLGTPSFGQGHNQGRYAEESEVDVESDWGGDEAQSELAPDDSASNISSSRHRRPKRRNERRTPAPVEEEDESEQ